jgi:hypothetical protein
VSNNKSRKEESEDSFQKYHGCHTVNKSSWEKRIERSRGEDVGQTVRGNGWLYTADDLGLCWRSSEPILVQMSG